MRTVVILVFAWIATTDLVGASLFSCKSAPEWLLPESDLVGVGVIQVHEPGQYAPCSLPTDGEVLFSEACGRPSTVVVEIDEYLLGDGPKSVHASFEPCLRFFEYPDVFELEPGVEVLLFLRKSDTGYEVVGGESGILFVELLPPTRAQILVQSFELTLHVELTHLQVGESVPVTQTLRNLGDAAFLGCIGKNSAFRFSNGDEGYETRLGDTRFGGKPSCARTVALQRGEAISWTDEVGVPLALGKGLVTVIVDLEIVTEPECDEFPCGVASLTSESAAFTFHP